MLLEFYGFTYQIAFGGDGDGTYNFYLFYSLQWLVKIGYIVVSNLLPTFSSILLAMFGGDRR